MFGKLSSDRAFGDSASAWPTAHRSTGAVGSVLSFKGADGHDTAPHSHFRLTDYIFDSLIAPATVEPVGLSVVEIPAVADGSDQAVLINAFMQTSDADVFVLPPGEFWIESSIFIPEGKSLIGAGQELTSINVLPDFGPLPGWSAIVAQSGSRLADLTVDVYKTNLGEGSSQRICGVIGTGNDFLVERVTSVNATGYAFWAMSTDPDDPASGTFRDCYGENSNVLFETTHVDGVLFENCDATDGDGDIAIAGVYHPVTGSQNVTFRDCDYVGNYQAVNVVADVADQYGILFDNVHAVTGRAISVFIAPGGSGNYRSEVTFINSSFVSLETNGANIYGADIHAENTLFGGAGIGFAALTGSTAEMIDSIAVAVANPSYSGAVFGVYALGAVTWDGGYLSGSGAVGSAASVGVVTVSGRTSLLNGDLATVTETTHVSVDVAANDTLGSDAAGLIVSIDGTSVTVGDTATLISGATVTLNADGTLKYDPNGAFNALVAGSSGAANSFATDQFTYTLASGETAAVRVRVDGLSSPEDRYLGSSGGDSISGSAAADMMLLQQGGDDIVAGLDGNDTFYFGASLTGTDRVDGGGGMDRLVAQGQYATGVLLAAASLTGVERLALLSGRDASFGDVGGNSYDYRFTTADPNVPPGGKLIIEAANLAPGEDLYFNGSAERDGSFEFWAGLGHDTLIGGAGADTFLYSATYRLEGDSIDGGGGLDRLVLRGAFGTGVTFIDGGMTNVETIQLVSAAGNGYFGYNLALHDSNIAAGQTLLVDGSALRFGEALMFNGGKEANGSLRILGGASNDYLHGGGMDDFFKGGLGQDYLRGNGGADTFGYAAAAESTGKQFDRIVGFDCRVDKIDLPFVVAGWTGHVVEGTLRTTTFDADLAAALNDVLEAHSAVLFTPSQGDFTGRIFGIIDSNGDGQYQAGLDYVFEFVTPAFPLPPIMEIFV